MDTWSLASGFAEERILFEDEAEAADANEEEKLGRVVGEGELVLLVLSDSAGTINRSNFTYTGELFLGCTSATRYSC